MRYPKEAVERLQDCLENQSMPNTHQNMMAVAKLVDFVEHFRPRKVSEEKPPKGADVVLYNIKKDGSITPHFFTVDFPESISGYDYWSFFPPIPQPEPPKSAVDRVWEKTWESKGPRIEELRLINNTWVTKQQLEAIAKALEEAKE